MIPTKADKLTTIALSVFRLNGQLIEWGNRFSQPHGLTSARWQVLGAEDETGAVNVIVWPRVAEAQRRALLASTLMTVYGTWQREGDGEHAVMHLVAARMVDHSALLQGLVSRSRNFR